MIETDHLEWSSSSKKDQTHAKDKANESTPLSSDHNDMQGDQDTSSSDDEDDDDDEQSSDSSSGPPKQADTSNLTNSLLVGQDPISPATSEDSRGESTIASTAKVEGPSTAGASPSTDIHTQYSARGDYSNRTRKASRRNSAISYDAASSAPDSEQRPQPPSSSKIRRTDENIHNTEKEKSFSNSADQSLPSMVKRMPAFRMDALHEGEHIDLATYPTARLLSLLASLLQHIAAANDKFRLAASESAQSRMHTAPTSPLTPLASGTPADLGIGTSASAFLKRPEMAKPSLARVTPYYTPYTPSASTSRRSSSANLRDYFSARPLTELSPTSAISTPAHLAFATMSMTSSSDLSSFSSAPSSGSKQRNGKSHTSDDPQTKIVPYFGLEDDEIGTDNIRELDIATTAGKVSYLSRNATLCFHARNIPGIGIDQYLQRILKYCPTTNEVFISLLIYFDRMAQYSTLQSLSAESAEDPTIGMGSSASQFTPSASHLDSTRFAVDSFNIHRLIIAGLTVASKFFSDVFYTNSRYAKVGGLPLTELNQLELQFLLLNDFSLQIDLEEIQRYADMLCLHWSKASAGMADLQAPPFTTWYSPRPVAATLHGAHDYVETSLANGPDLQANLASHKRQASSTSSLVRPAFERLHSERASSESGSSTLTGRSDTSSVCSTGTITHAETNYPQFDSLSAVENSSSGLDTSMDIDESCNQSQ